MTEITFTLLLQCIIMFILGQGVHLFFIKIPALKKRSTAANKLFVFKDWWSCDWNIIIGTQLFGALIVFGLNELVDWKPEILTYVRWFFAGIGAFGSTVAMSLLSKYDKTLIQVLDIKSNIADTVTGGTTSVEETIRKGSQATQSDVTQHAIVDSKNS